MSFFNSWLWISCWLDSLPPNLKIEFIVVERSSVPIACFFLGVTKNIQNKFYKKRGHLNCSGVPDYDTIVTEYNSILCQAGEDPAAILSFAMESLNDIEEFRLPLTFNLEAPSKMYFKREETCSAYWTDLNKITKETDYFSLISKNKRSQIKRTLKEYQKQGDISFAFANSLTEAKDFFSRLEALHQKEWSKRGQPGAFSNPYFKKFHTLLIERGFGNNEAQLARVHTPKEDIGYLYYFVFNNEILFYQSGFNYKPNNLYRPGLVCHYVATMACARKNYLKYNFLAGDAQYKKSLSTNQDKLSSFIVSRKTMKSKIEQVLRRCGGRV